jgi:hypothetical protein
MSCAGQGFEAASNGSDQPIIQPGDVPTTNDGAAQTTADLFAEGRPVNGLSETGLASCSSPIGVDAGLRQLPAVSGDRWFTVHVPCR